MPEFISDNVVIRSPADDAELERYFHLRWQLLREPWGQLPGSERDQLEQSATHICAVYNDNLIGVGRLHLQSAGVARIRYMGVAVPFQGKGVGRLILGFLEREARQQSCGRINLDAREDAVSFYQRLGFEEVGQGHTLFGVIRHIQMSKNTGE